MMQDFMYQEEQILSFSTIRAMVRVLNSELLKNSSLANDLFLFLKERNIEIPASTEDRRSNQPPISYGTNKSPEQIYKLKKAFEGVKTTESIL